MKTWVNSDAICNSMKKYLKKNFKGTGHVLGSGDPSTEERAPTNQQALLEKLEAKKPKKPPPKVSLTEHLRRCEESRRNAPLQFCQDVPTPVKEEDDVEEDMNLQISILISNPELSDGAVGLLRRVLRNLILSPNEVKYQKLKTTNAKVQEGLVRVPGAVEFLALCGFVEKEEQLVYEGASSMELPRKGLTLLNQHFPEEVKQANKPEVQRPETPPAVDVPKRERRTQLLLMKPAADTTVPDWFFERTGAEIKHEYFSMIRRREQDETFMSRDQREKLKQPAVQYEYAVVRVRLPEGVLLQGEFDAAEGIIRIHEWIAEQLRDMTRPFEIVLPSRARLGLKGTVSDSQLMPASLLSFHWADGQGMTTQEPTVRDELVTSAIIDWE